VKSLSAQQVKDNLGRLIDTTRAAPLVTVNGHRPIIVVLFIEGYDRLKVIDSKNEAA
jgi:hypothetical protein